jgi:hypothetical protein
MNREIASVLILLLLFIPALADDAKKTLTSAEREAYEILVQNGFLKIEAKSNKAYVHPEFWKGLDAEQKRGFSYGLAIYCANERGNELYYVTIYDLQSAKKLAKYSKSWGFEVY